MHFPNWWTGSTLQVGLLLWIIAMAVIVRVLYRTPRSKEPDVTEAVRSVRGKLEELK